MGLETDHRPWPLPDGPWVQAQTWSEVLFAHWPLPPEVLRPLIPEALALDTRDGMAWVGVVPFQMRGVRLRWTPPVPYLSRFPELNVRTYVTVGGKPGVYFFSLEAARGLIVAIARAWFRLPYYRARMSIERANGSIQYESDRTHSGARPARFRATYRPTSPVYRAAPGTLEHWLTERYCLYTVDQAGRPFRGEIHHPPWPLQQAEAQITENSMAQASGIALPDSRPLLHYSSGVDVIVWPLKRA